MFLDSGESLSDYVVLVDAYIHNKAKLSRKEFLEKLNHVKYIRTKRNTRYLSFYITEFEEYQNLHKFHDLINKGIFDFENEFVFAIAIEPQLFNWFKTTDYLTIVKQIVCWLSALYFFNPDKRNIMQAQIYTLLFEEILKINNQYFDNYNLPNFKELAKTNFEVFDQEMNKSEQKYLEVCKDYYGSEPPEFLISPFGYEAIEGWGLTESGFSFNIIQSYFREDDWEKIFEKGEDVDNLHRVESRGDLWEKWKLTFGTFDKSNNFIYSFFYTTEATNKTQKKIRRETISNSVRNFVWKRDEGKCVDCGSNEKLEFDHIIPVIKGGSSTYRNLQLLCENCNRKKHAKI